MIMMQTTSIVFARELSKLVVERQKTLTENVASGLAISSYEQYREYVGRLAELNEVLEMMNEAEANVNKR
jgi:hypothetical protein